MEYFTLNLTTVHVSRASVSTVFVCQCLCECDAIARKRMKTWSDGGAGPRAGSAI